MLICARAVSRVRGFKSIYYAVNCADLSLLECNAMHNWVGVVRNFEFSVG